MTPAPTPSPMSNNMMNPYHSVEYPELSFSPAPYQEECSPFQHSLPAHVYGPELTAQELPLGGYHEEYQPLTQQDYSPMLYAPAPTPRQEEEVAGNGQTRWML
jgi:hypothetical protein